MTKLIILDRDGVINYDSDAYIKSTDEWIPIPGSIEAIARLKQADYTIAIATNQSGIGRGLYSMDTFAAMCEKMDILVDQAGGYIDGIFFCPHTPDDHCECRKPKTGLLEQIAETFSISLLGVTMIGDSLRDIEVSQATGGTPILVRTGKGERTLASHAEALKDIAVYSNLACAVDAILKSR